MTTQLTQLDNGLRIATEVMPGARSVALAAFVGVGSRDEPLDAAGSSHFLEHLLFKGGAHRSARELAEAIDGVGGDLNAFTTHETTAFAARVPAEALALGADVLRDVVVDPRFDTSDVETERQVIDDELRLSNEIPEDRANRLLAERLFSAHPLGREILGTTESVAALAPSTIATFHRRNYRPDRLVVAAVGAVDHDWLVDHAEGWFDDGPGAVTLERQPPEPLEAGVFIEPDDGDEVHLLRAWRALPVGDERRHLMHLAAHVLGGGPASRLFQAIREERGLAYSVYATVSAFTDAGALVVGSSAAAERFDELRRVVDAEVDRFLTDGITERELTTAKGYISGALVIDLEDPTSRMMRLGSNLTLRDELPDLDTYLTAVEATTTDDLGRFIAAVFDAASVTAVVGSLEPASILGPASTEP